LYTKEPEIEGLSILWLFKWIAGVLLFYFLAGSIYRAVWLDKRGVEIIPNHGVWRDLLQIIHDFSCNLANRLKGRGGYQEI
jgi:hypothetical protein